MGRRRETTHLYTLNRDGPRGTRRLVERLKRVYQLVREHFVDLHSKRSYIRTVAPDTRWPKASPRMSLLSYFFQWYPTGAAEPVGSADAALDANSPAPRSGGGCVNAVGAGDGSIGLETIASSNGGNGSDAKLAATARSLFPTVQQIRDVGRTGSTGTNGSDHAC